ncbi:11813_t:CDS:2, partial [Racocetra persica]
GNKVKTPKMRTFIKTQLSQLDRILQLEKEQEDPRIRTGLRQLKQRLNSMETNYKYVSQLSRQQTNEHIQKIERKNRNLVKDLEKEYGYITNQALNLDRKDFEAMQEQMEQCESKLLRKQYQAKYRKLLGVSLENLDKMHDVEDEEERMFQEQQRARRQGLELPETLSPKHPYHEEYLPTVNELRETEQMADR